MFCGVILYKVTYHLEKKAKRDEVLKGSDHGRSVAYRPVDGEQLEQDENGEHHQHDERLRSLSPKGGTEFYDDDELPSSPHDGQHQNGTAGVEIVSIIRNDGTKIEII